MNGVAFTICLLCGLDQCECEEMVLRQCVERTVPRKAWRQDVKAEIKRQKAVDPDLALTDYLCGAYYVRHVDARIREGLLDCGPWQENDSWSFEERLWLATRGEFGDAPPAWKRVVLAGLVRKIGRRLPCAVREGVPK